MSGPTASVGSYLGVLGALLGLTAVTVGIAFVDLGPFNTVVALAIAGGKAMLVAVFFMHLRYASALDRLFAAAGLLFLLLLIGLTVIEWRSREPVAIADWINVARVRCGLTAASFTDAPLTPGATVVKTIHVTELRSALDAAYFACSRTPPAYTDPLTAGATVIMAAHIVALRDAVMALDAP